MDPIPRQRTCRLTASQINRPTIQHQATVPSVAMLTQRHRRDGPPNAWSSAPDEEECAGTLQLLQCVTQVEVAIDRRAARRPRVFPSEGSWNVALPSPSKAATSSPKSTGDSSNELRNVIDQCGKAFRRHRALGVFVAHARGAALLFCRESPARSSRALECVGRRSLVNFPWFREYRFGHPTAFWRCSFARWVVRRTPREPTHSAASDQRGKPSAPHPGDSLVATRWREM
jgi:hypothetical protein